MKKTTRWKTNDNTTPHHHPATRELLEKKIDSAKKRAREAAA
jgi:hypothetical protein